MTNTTQKIVHQSKRVVLEKVNQLSDREIVDCILSIVKFFVNDNSRRQMYIDIILFDTLNQILATSKRKKEIIAMTYEELEIYLCQDPHYWLQRSKSIYRMNSSNREKLDISYQYARKAYEDGRPAVSSKAALSLSLICGLIAKCTATEDEENGFLIECVSFAHEALFSSFYFGKERILKIEILGDRHGFPQILKNACEKVLQDNSSEDICEKANQISEKLKDLIS